MCHLAGAGAELKGGPKLHSYVRGRMMPGMYVVAYFMQKVCFLKAIAKDGAHMISIFKAEAVNFIDTRSMGVGRGTAQSNGILSLEAGTSHDILRLYPYTLYVGVLMSTYIVLSNGQSGKRLLPENNVGL
jgi:hypothetical protein